MTVDKGEVVSVIGGSGSGKSTLLMCINGLEPINSGRILVDGIDVHARGTDLNKLRRKIGIVFQQWNAFPHLTVLENVMLAPRKVLGMSRGRGRGDGGREALPCRARREAEGLSRQSSPAASSSAWRSPARWPCRLTTCCSTR